MRARTERSPRSSPAATAEDVEVAFVNKAVHLADGLELVDAGHYLDEVRRVILDGSQMAFSPRRYELEGLTEKVDEAR
jgi:hypothetical protein